jgi:hypothetical protein
MISPEKVTAILEKNVALMNALKGQMIGGFAIIIPPEGEPIEFVTLGSQSDQKSFFKYLTDKISGSVEANQYGGVRMPGGIR